MKSLLGEKKLDLIELFWGTGGGMKSVWRERGGESGRGCDIDKMCLLPF